MTPFLLITKSSPPSGGAQKNQLPALTTPCGLLLTFLFTPCLWCSQHNVCPCTTSRWTSTFSTLRVMSIRDLAQRTLQACNVALSLVRSLPHSQQHCHATCESSWCHVLLLILPLWASSSISYHTLPLTLWSPPLSRYDRLYSLQWAVLWLVYAYFAKLYIPMHVLAHRILQASNCWARCHGLRVACGALRCQHNL